MSGSNLLLDLHTDSSGGRSGGLVSHRLKNFLQFIVIHTVKGFDLINKAEIDVFLKLSCFFDDPEYVGNLISSSCAFSKTSLNIWKFTVHVLLKPCLENFEHHFTGICSVQFSHSVMSDSLQPHELQHARLPCPSPTPRACSNSCSLSRWCHPTISSSVIPFSSHVQSFPASGSFPKSQFFASDGQSIGASVSASVLPMNIQGWILLGLSGWISLYSKGL